MTKQSIGSSGSTGSGTRLANRGEPGRMKQFLIKRPLQRYRKTLKANILSLATYICPLSNTVVFSALNETVRELFKQKSDVRFVSFIPPGLDE